MGRIDREREQAVETRSNLAVLQAAQRLGFAPDAPCSYPAHRATDWRKRDGGPPQCGICHPPVEGLDVVLVNPEPPVPA
jgi:hypothetical protein